jgi:hypothetical protein
LHDGVQPSCRWASRRRAPRAWYRWATWAVVLLVGFAWLVPTTTPERAVAAPLPTAIDSGYSVTYVVRSCTSYEAILANKARNNIQESLRDLGPDFVSPGAYTDTTALVSAQVEDNAPTQDAGCSPFPEPWRFTLGQGLRGGSSTSLNLSTVTRPDAVDVVAQPGSIPELNDQGQDTGRDVESAVTVNVTTAQAQRLNTGGALWVQGGTPAAPLNNQEEEYGFASLRCANDALNGDNVEQVGWPSGVKHVFCYTFLVTPPPESATVTVTKQLAAGSPGSGSFLYEGDNDSSNISYEDTDGNGVNDFRLDNVTAAQPRSESFVRGATRPEEGDLPWTFAEQPQEGWALVGGAPTCTSDDQTSTFDIDGPHVAVTLGAGDNVLCTYVNEPDLPSSAALYKQTLGGVGTFAFAGTGPGLDESTTVTTTQEGQAEPFFTSDELEAGDYTVTETLPAPTPEGSWELTQVLCENDLDQLTDYTEDIESTGLDRTLQFTVAQGRTSTCLFTDTFTPTTGSLTLGKVTVNGDGFRETVGEDPAFTLQAFPVAEGEPVDFDGTTFEEPVPVPEDGTPVEVTPPLTQGDGPPDTSGGLPVGSPDEPAFYVLRELVPVALLQGRWEPTGVTCVDGDGDAADFVVIDDSQNAILVALTYDQPDLTCAAENTWIPNSALIVEKTATDNETLRPDSVEMVLSCDQDLDVDGDGDLDPAFDDPFTVAPGQTAGGTGQLLPADTTCTLDEDDTGAAPQVQVTTTYRVSDITDPENPIRLPELDDQTTYTIPEGKVYRVDVLNEYAAYPTISVLKQATSDTSLRPADVTVSLTCDDDTAEDLTLAAGDRSAVIGPVVLQPGTACTVAEPAGGQADGVTWRISDITVDGIDPEPAAEPPAAGDPLTLELPPLTSGTAVTVTITNAYEPPVGPTPTPSPTLTPSPAPTPEPPSTTDPSSGSSSSSTASLAETGASQLLTRLAALGGLLATVGAGLIIGNRRPS